MKSLNVIHFSEQRDFFHAVLPQQTEYILLHFDQTSISNLNNKNKCRCLDAQLSVFSNTKLAKVPKILSRSLL